jgi:hypothetical protein
MPPPVIKLSMARARTMFVGLAHPSFRVRTGEQSREIMPMSRGSPALKSKEPRDGRHRRWRF